MDVLPVPGDPHNTVGTRAATATPNALVDATIMP
jgi:hypothetical protein